MQRAHVFDRDQAFAKLLADLKEELSHPELIDAQVGQRGIRHKIDRRAHDILAHRPDLLDSVIGRRHLGWRERVHLSLEHVSTSDLNSRSFASREGISTSPWRFGPEPEIRLLD